MKLKNKISVLLTAITISASLMTTAVYASDGVVPETSREVGVAKEDPTEKEASPEKEKTDTEVQELIPEEFKTDEQMGDMLETIFGLMLSGLEETEASEPLTPEGNLSIVDDVGPKTGEGKQFITVTTKTGNYYYIIIDRDKDGEGTVHFLNQVDEPDLLNLMDEESKEEYLSQKPEVEEPEVPEEEVPEDPEPIPDPEPEKQEKTIGWTGIMGFAALVLLGVAGIVSIIFKKQKKKKRNTPDPDEEYYDEDVEEDVIE